MGPNKREGWAGSADFEFEQRNQHDVDKLAGDVLQQRLDAYKTDERVRLEYSNTKERYWHVLYPSYEQFKHQFLASQERLLRLASGGGSAIPPGPVTSGSPPEPVSDDLKRQIRERDGGCLACGSTYRLQVDHILPAYLRGANTEDNLQTLCPQCNARKGRHKIKFLDPTTDLSGPPDSLPELNVPRGDSVGKPAQWERFLRGTVNFFYECGAVHRITIGKKGPTFHEWRIELKGGNDPCWLEPHLPALLDRIAEAKRANGYGHPTALVVSSPGATRSAAGTTAAS